MQRPTDERRVVSVLFADLVGYTTLAETRDPEQVKRLVDRCFERLVADIVSFGGQVDKIIGDAIVALFGAPVAHEDDAERAVRAALRMEETLNAYAGEWAGGIMRMRIGVNTGEVLVGALRAGGDYTAMGDVVNIASRLQAAAAPGEVLVGATTWAATRAAIRFEARGALSVKGRDEAVETFVAREVLLPPGHRSRRPDVPMVGRESEVSLLRNAVNGAVRHERALLSLLIGEAGVGKTRLAGEIGKWVSAAHGAIVFEGRCVPYGEANLWWPVAEALRAVLHVKAGASLEEACRRTEARTGEMFSQETSSPEVVRTANGLLYLMGYEVQLREIDPVNARDEAVRSLVKFLEAAADMQPVVIQLSDLHWADDMVLELIDTLLERLARTRLVIFATAREQLTERWSPRAGRHNVVVEHLEPLGAEAATQLLDLLLCGAPAEVRDLLLERGGGNPFFLEELVSLLDAQSTVPGAAGPAGLPDTLRGLVAARLDALPVAERAVLQDASVFGREGIVEGLVRMAEGLGRRIDIPSALSGLRAKEILAVEHGRWSFRSDLVREVAYNTLTKVDRAIRHAGIANYLEHYKGGAMTDDLVDRLAHHYGMAASMVVDLGRVEGLPPDLTDHALHWIDEAAVRAERSEVLPVAMRLYTQGLELVGEVPSTLRLKFLLGRAGTRSETWDLPGAREDVQTACDEAEVLGDQAAGAHALVVLGDVESKSGDADSARAHLRDAIARFEALGDERGRGDALRKCGMAEMFDGRFDDARRTVEEALAAFEVAGDEGGRAWALQNLAWIAFLTGRVATAEDHLDASVALFTDIGDAVGLAWAYGLLGYVRLQQGRFAEASVLAEQILVEARTRGDRWACAMMVTLSATLRLWEGSTEEAVELATEAHDAFLSIGDEIGEALSLSTLGVARVLSGRVQEGLDTFADSRAVIERPVEGIVDPRGPIALANCGAVIGEPDRVLEVLELAAPSDFDGTDDVGPGSGERPMLVAAAALQMGDVLTARRLVAPLMDGESEGALNPSVASILALVEAADGHAEAVAELRPAVLQAPTATYLDRMRVEIAAGLLAARQGDEAGAVSAFTSALDVVDRTGDRVSQAITRLGYASALRAMGDSTETVAMTADAAGRLEALGITAVGWSTAFALCLGLDASV